MPINYEAAMKFKGEAAESSYNQDRCILYALGVGFGRDPMDLKELDYVYEKNLKTVPTMAAVLGGGGIGRGDAAHPMSQINFAMVLHGEQRLTLHRPIPPSGTLVSTGSIEAI